MFLLSPTEQLSHCSCCGANHVQTFDGEVALHLRGMENLDKPATFVFPKVLVCLDCGASQFFISGEVLHSLARNSSISGTNAETPNSSAW